VDSRRSTIFPGTVFGTFYDMIPSAWIGVFVFIFSCIFLFLAMAPSKSPHERCALVDLKFQVDNQIFSKLDHGFNVYWYHARS
jgi:hypothetical protein